MSKACNALPQAKFFGPRHEPRFIDSSFGPISFGVSVKPNKLGTSLHISSSMHWWLDQSQLCTRKVQKIMVAMAWWCLMMLDVCFGNWLGLEEFRDELRRLEVGLLQGLRTESWVYTGQSRTKRIKTWRIGRIGRSTVYKRSRTQQKAHIKN